MKNLIIVCLLTISLVSHAAEKNLFIVAQDSTGDFTSVQAAIDATKAFPAERITIFVKKGVYREKVKIHAWNNLVSLIGESAQQTIITWNDHFNQINRGRNSTFHTATVLVQGNDFVAENLTIENSAGPVGQAIALAVEADRGVFRNLRIVGNQDALYAAGQNCRQYYENCYIEGTTDFIFGAATALFSHCTINSKSNSFITAASTPEGLPFGFVFDHCQLTAEPGVTEVYLGRPWRKFAKTVFINCDLGAHIQPEGWKTWSNADDIATTFYAEYKSRGAGADTSKRVAWSKQLTEAEAATYSKENILKAQLPVDPELWGK
jgi:pectinesterase